MFETETMADLLWQQGHADDAVALCGRLAARALGEEHHRLAAKLEMWRGSSSRALHPKPDPEEHAARGSAADRPPAEGARPRGAKGGGQGEAHAGGHHEAHAGGHHEAHAGGRREAHAAGQASLILSLASEGLTLTWSLPPSLRPSFQAPVAELLVIRIKRPEGALDVQRRTLPLGALSGSLALPVADLHSARAAAGFLETNTFHPLARSALVKA